MKKSTEDNLLHIHRLRKLSEKNWKDDKACLSFVNRFETVFEIWQFDILYVVCLTRIFTRRMYDENFYTSHVWRKMARSEKEENSGSVPPVNKTSLHRPWLDIFANICKWQIHCCQHKRCCSWCEISIYVKSRLL